jgi:uridylate kinase
MEIGAEAIFKGTKVDGVYDKDPLLNKGARKYNELSYLDVLKRQIKVMDATAISLCMGHQIPIIVFSLKEKGNIKRLILGDRVGTRVRG